MARINKPLRDLDKAVSHLLFTLAAEQGISQNELFRQTGISQNRVGIIFRCERPATVGEVEIIANVLGTSASTVVAAAEWMTTKERPAILTDREANQIADWFEQAAKAGYDFLAEQEQQAE